MDKERLAYSSSKPLDTFGNQYMYQNVIPPQNVVAGQDISQFPNIAQPEKIIQNTAQPTAQPPVRQSPLNQMPIPQSTQFQQNYQRIPPEYGHVERGQYMHAQQSSQSLPDFQIQQTTGVLSEKLSKSPEKSGTFKFCIISYSGK